MRLSQPLLTQLRIEPLDFQLIDDANEKIKESIKNLSIDWNYTLPQWVLLPTLLMISFLLCVIACRIIPYPKRSVNSVMIASRKQEQREGTNIPLHQCY